MTRTRRGNALPHPAHLRCATLPLQGRVTMRCHPRAAPRIRVTCRARREAGKVRFVIHHSPLAFFFPHLKRGGRTPTDAGKTAALARGARSAERARLSAFHRGSHLRESFIPKARLQARFPGDAVRTGVTRLRLSQSREHLPPRSSCRGTDTQAARERTANPPAGTAPAPPYGMPPEGVPW
jgi:hypothetical protein